MPVSFVPDILSIQVRSFVVPTSKCQLFGATCADKLDCHPPYFIALESPGFVSNPHIRKALFGRLKKQDVSGSTAF